MRYGSLVTESTKSRQRLAGAGHIIGDGGTILQDPFVDAPFLKVLNQFVSWGYGRRFQPIPGVQTQLLEAGHVLGSAQELHELQEDGKIYRLGFTGDLGRFNLPILRDPVVLSDLDGLIIESTYGNRLHDPTSEVGDELAEKEAVVLVAKPRAADIALFGRMLADNPVYNIEAAAQVAHAFTTHRVSVEDDYYTAVDDLKAANREADRGAGFIGVQEYGAGIFYLYLCLDASQLVRNLPGDKALAATTAEALVDAACTVSPKGKQNSFASRAYATFALAEMGSRTPRSLAAAFLRPVGGAGDPENDYGTASVERLKGLRGNFDRAYGQCWTKDTIMDVFGGQGSLEELKALAREAVHAAAA